MVWVAATGAAGGSGFKMELYSAEVEVFFKSVGLEQIGEFERADVAAALTDFALEIGNDVLDLLRPMA